MTVGGHWQSLYVSPETTPRSIAERSVKRNPLRPGSRCSSVLRDQTVQDLVADYAATRRTNDGLFDLGGDGLFDTLVRPLMVEVSAEVLAEDPA